MTAMTETRAKYTADELQAMLAKGHAIKNANGDPSYPIADSEDLHNAIHAVGRGGSDHNAIRRHIIGRAKALGMSSSIPDNWNEDGSLGDGDNDADDRASRTPLEVLRRRRGSMIRKLERRGMVLEMRAKPSGTGGTDFVFEGYGATFDEPFQMWDNWGDPYTEVVRPGAFTRSLAGPGLDVPFLIGHNDQGIPLARTRNGTMQLAEDSRGLHVRAQMDGSRSDVRNLASAVERGDLDEMSIGFVTMGQEWSPDWETRAMLDLELHRGDVSAVALAANPRTAGATMTALPVESLSRKAAEERSSRGEIADNSNAPDYNLAPGAAPYDASAHGSNSLTCPNDGCPVYAGGDGDRALNAQDAKFCDQCGAPLYNSDGLIVVDDSGVVEEVGGSMADANLLSLRLRVLELA